MFEGGDLRGGGGGLHLLAEAGDLAVAVGDVGLLRAAEDFFFLQRCFGGGESDFRFGAGGLGGENAAGGFGELFAEAFEFQVLRLEDDEVFEVGVHRVSFLRRKSRDSVGEKRSRLREGSWQERGMA